MLLAAALALAACGGGNDADSASAPAAQEPAAQPAMEPAELADADLVATGDGSGAIDLGTIGRDVIIEMHVVMSSDDIERTVTAITATASQLGGGIASSSIDYGDPTDPDQIERGSAVLVVKVPPNAIDRLVAGLDATGTVRSIEQSAQDVTEQLVDLGIRIDNARESVDNVRRFMDQAEDLNDLVTLEGELTRRLTTLEQLEAQQRNLSERVALSTITVEVRPTSSIPPVGTDDSSIGGALRDGWDAFVTFLHAVVYVLAVLLPFLVLAAVAAVTVRLVVRRRTARSSRSSPAPPAVAGEDPVRDASVGEGERGA